MKYPIERELLHAVMRLCLRLTRSYDIAVKFADLGGIEVLLNLTQKSSFNGVLPLANLLMRHVIEDPSCLRYAVEKVNRTRFYKRYNYN
jgi:E3 ubiquitin-protein ligase HUWE1